MRNPLCLLLTIWYTLRTGAWLQGAGATPLEAVKASIALRNGR